MRAGRNADRRRRADVADLCLRRAVGVEYLNALIAGIRDVDVAFGVERDAAQRIELPRLGAALPPRLDEVPVLVEFRDTGVAGADSHAISDIDVAGLVPGDAAGANEAVAWNAGAWRSGRSAAAACRLRAGRCTTPLG